jgi:hypothetical protein
MFKNTLLKRQPFNFRYMSKTPLIIMPFISVFHLNLIRFLLIIKSRIINLDYKL